MAHGYCRRVCQPFGGNGFCLGALSNIGLANEVQLNPFADVEAGLLRRLDAVDVGQSPQAEPVAPRGVDVPVHDDGGPTAGHLEHLADLRFEKEGDFLYCFFCEYPLMISFFNISDYQLFIKIIFLLS